MKQNSGPLVLIIAAIIFLATAFVIAIVKADSNRLVLKETTPTVYYYCNDKAYPAYKVKVHPDKIVITENEFTETHCNDYSKTDLTKRETK